MRIPKMIENGMVDYCEPEDRPVFCPECGEECSFIYVKDGDVIGCDNCVEEMSSDTWRDEHD